MSDKTYTLIYLNERLQKTGLSRRCLKYELSNDKTSLHIAYLDYLLSEQFIFVFRTSRLAYRIYYKGKLTRKKTCSDAAQFIEEILSAIIEKADFYNVLTVAELNRMEKMTHSKSLDLYIRTKKT